MNGAPSNPVAIDVKGLSKSFGGREVVHDLSMQVKRGSIYGFLGPNGSGKTTTIRMLCGLLTPDRGEGTCLGYDIRRDADRIKRLVGYMTQRFSLYQDLSVRENLEFVARLYGMPDVRGAARDMIKRLGLSGREEQLAGELSGGWKQRLALGCAILHDPPIVFLDEPTSGLDPLMEKAFQQCVREVAERGAAVLLSSHILAEVEARIRAINPYAKLHRTERCKVALSDVLERGAFDLDRILEIEPEFLEAGDGHDHHDHDHDHGHDHHHAHDHGGLKHYHDEEMQSLSLRSERPLDPAKFMPWLQNLVASEGQNILRSKGILAFSDDNDRYVFQGVHMMLEGDHQRPWKEGETRESRVVFIGRELPEQAIREGFESCITG